MITYFKKERNLSRNRHLERRGAVEQYVEQPIPLNERVVDLALMGLTML